MVTEYRNEPWTDFSQPENVAAYEAALVRMRQRLGQRHQLYLGGEWVEAESGETFDSTNPSRPAEVVGSFARAGVSDAEKAMQAAEAAFPAWSRTPVAERAELLFRVAKLMRERKHDFNAMMTLEEGKTWPEADGDTAESIDFLEFYGREMLRYAGRGGEVTPSPVGDKNWTRYLSLGVGVIIPPWNFPNAILAGMSAAAIVTGNTVILKPASDSPMLGLLVTELFIEAGVPVGVLNLLTGPGAIAGDYLVRHPRTRFISFTGSMEVGKGINEKAARFADGQIWIKRVVAEMGGKDAILIDSDADLDMAAEAIVASAFGFQGQKCSACSRALIHADIYDTLVPKIVARAGQIVVGDPAAQATTMGPVINRSALQKCLDYIAIGRQDGELLLGGETIERDGGWFIEPTIFGGIAPSTRMEQDEIFGPVLALVKVDSYAHGVQVFNGTIYGLTGGYIGTRHLADAEHDLFVGNLYLNRKCTGALVDVEPFGGYNMSGTCSKAGGRDYLGLFMQMKAICQRELPQ